MSPERPIVVSEIRRLTVRGKGLVLVVLPVEGPRVGVVVVSGDEEFGGRRGREPSASECTEGSGGREDRAMSLERDGPGRTLENEVVALLAELGWTSDGSAYPEYVERAGRVTYRASLSDLLGFAARYGLEALRRKLERESLRLERDSTRNRFRESRLSRYLAEETSARLERVDGRLSHTPPGGGVPVDSRAGNPGDRPRRSRGTPVPGPGESPVVPREPPGTPVEPGEAGPSETPGKPV